MGRIPLAQYREHPIRKYRGNPLIEALPRPLKSKPLEELAGFKVNTTADFWTLDEVYRKSEIQDIARTHVPGEKFISFYEKCFAMILNSYSHRNPFSPDAMALKMQLGLNLHKKQLNQQSGLISASEKNAPCCLVTGLSGSGKTTMIRNALKCIPQVIQHENYGDKPYKQKQIAWLSMDLPSTSSCKALALSFFRSIEEVTGDTDIYTKWEKRNRDSVESHLAGMQVLASTYEIGLVHIDELQFMLKYGKTKEPPTLQILEALFNKIGIPVILSCTDSGLALFDTAVCDGKTTKQEITTLRRMLSDRSFQLKTYARSNALFYEMIRALYPEEMMLNCADLSDAFVDCFYELTQGLPMFMSRLAQLHHEYLSYLYGDGEKADSIRTDDVQHLKAIHASQFQLFSQALSFLKQGNLRKYESTIADMAGDTEMSHGDINPSTFKTVKSAKKAPLISPKAPSFGNSSDGQHSLTDMNTPFLVGLKEEG